MNKYLITVEIPTMELEYDLYIPNNKKVGTIKKYILESIANLSDDSFVKELNEVRMMNKETASELNNNVYVKDSGIKNGSKIIII